MTRKFPKAGIVLLAAFVLAAGCGKSLRTQYLQQTAFIEPVHCVAVMPFENLTPYPRAGDIVSDFFATELYASRKFRVVDRLEVQGAARRINLRIPEHIGAEFARQLGERMQVDGVVFGSVTEYWYPNTAGSQDSEQVLKGDEPAVGVSARLLSVQNGEVLWSSSTSRGSFAVAADQRDPLSRVAQLAIADMVHPLLRELRDRQIDLLQTCGVAVAPMEGRFHGRIVDSESGKPVAKAVMAIQQPAEARVQVSPESGEFLSGPLVAGTNQYVAMAEGYETAKGSVEILSNENVSLDVRLARRVAAAPPKPGVLLVRVVDGRGVPVPANLKLDPDPGTGILKLDDVSGKVRTEIRPGSYVATVTAQGFRPREKTFQIDAGQSVSFEIALESQAPPAPTGPARLEKDRIVLTEQILFEAGTSKIEETSYPILLQVAGILKEHAEVIKVQIEGHTDDRGGALVNQRLSQQRADAVVKFLIQAGVQGGRLSALGFGEAVPLADNSTPEGRSRNRRVEFTILDQR